MYFQILYNIYIGLSMNIKFIEGGNVFESNI